MPIFRFRALLSLLAALCIVSLTACSQQASSAAQSGAAGQSSSQIGSSGFQESSNQSELYGKVTAVNGSKITLALGTTNGGGRPGNGNRGAASGGGRQWTPSSGSAGRSASSGTRPRMGAAITLSGKTTTIAISDPGVIKKMSRGERRPQQSGASSSGKTDSSASLSDIKVGSILSVVKNSDGKITSVIILSDSGAQSAQ